MQIDFNGSLRIRVPEALGDAIMTTAVVRSLLDSCVDLSQLKVWTQHPSFFDGFCSDDRFECVGDYSSCPGDAVRLAEYLGRLPHSTSPQRHHILSMLDTVRLASGCIDNLPAQLPLPQLAIQSEDTKCAFEHYCSISEWRNSRKLVWLCPRSTTMNRNPSEDLWCQAIEEMNEKVAFIEFVAPNEVGICSPHIYKLKLKPVQVGAFMLLCDAGVAVDTFGLHLAASVGFQNVLVLLSSSHPDCVRYPGNRVIYRTSAQTKACQPCGNHGYVDSRIVLETLGLSAEYRFREDTCCLFDSIHCLENIRLEDVTVDLSQIL